MSERQEIAEVVREMLSAHGLLNRYAGDPDPSPEARRMKAAVRRAEELKCDTYNANVHAALSAESPEELREAIEALPDASDREMLLQVIARFPEDVPGLLGVLATTPQLEAEEARAALGAELGDHFFAAKIAADAVRLKEQRALVSEAERMQHALPAPAPVRSEEERREAFEAFARALERLRGASSRLELVRAALECDREAARLPSDLEREARERLAFTRELVESAIDLEEGSP